MNTRLITAALALVVLVGCHNKTPPSTDPVGDAHHLPSDVSAQLAPPQGPAAEVDKAMEQLRSNFKRVQFEYDAVTLTPASREILAQNAAILKKFTDLQVEIQGHCDERGSTDYNLALGQARANSTRNYLINLGVPKAQLNAVSYGEERPLVARSDDAAWSANRRAEFRVTLGGDGLVEDTLSQPAQDQAL